MNWYRGSREKAGLWNSVMNGKTEGEPRLETLCKQKAGEEHWLAMSERINEQQTWTVQGTRFACAVLSSIISKSKAEESKVKELYFLGCQGIQRPSVHNKELLGQKKLMPIPPFSRMVANLSGCRISPQPLKAFGQIRVLLSENDISLLTDYFRVSSF